MKKPANWPIFSFDLLLGAILVLLLATPFLENQNNPLLAFLFALVFFTCAYATSHKRWHLIISAVLGLPWLVLTILGVVTKDGPGTLFALGLFAIFTFYTAGVIIRHVTRSKEMTRNVISGGISVYFLLAIGWAVIFAIIQIISPGAVYFPEGESVTFSSFLYFSISSITTVGYGEVYPVLPVARMFAVMEAAVGFLFIGVFIARLIGQFRN